ncbi:DUF4352 domain-containing protein [Actinoplanes sp. NPDC049681]|uniref:DUF4352 domain-containing protein n=1 Tax=Actinoplanes sp. NPDC049681 TaxID=3363905 RepID=UPI0037957C5B
MTGQGQSATVSSSCPSCGAGMEVDQAAGVMRCPYCRREVPMPASQASGWPYGAGGTGVPHITISTSTRTIRQPPEVIRRQKLIAVVFLVGALLAVGGVLIPSFWSIFSGSSGDVEEVAVGATARVKSFEATVRGVDCSKKAITKPDDPATSYDDSATEKAKGKFCVVSFSVKNVGDKTDSYPTTSLEATSPTERVLERSTIAEMYANTKGTDLDEPIDPGKTVDQLLVYDVPADTTLAYLRISDDLFADSTIKVKVS